MQGLSIYRSWIYVSKSRSILMRLLNYFSFVFSALWYGMLRTQRYDVVLCESPPLFLGITAYLLSRFQSKDVRRGGGAKGRRDNRHGVD